MRAETRLRAKALARHARRPPPRGILAWHGRRVVGEGPWRLGRRVVPTENSVHNPIELELLVRHLGKAKGIELVRLSRIPGAPGIAPAAIDALGAAVEAFAGLYGEPSEARHALEDLRERFPS